MKKRIFSTLITSMMVLALLSGCAGEKNQDTSDTAVEDTANEEDTATNEEAANEESGEIQPLIYDNPYQGIKFTLPAYWYAGVNEKQNIIFESYEYGLQVGFLTSEGMQIMKELQESIAQLPEDATSYTDEQNAMIEKMYQELIPVGLILLEHNGIIENELRAEFTNANELGEAGQTAYTLLFDSTPDMSKMTEEDKAEFQSIWEAMFEIEKDITFSGYKSIEQLQGDVQFDTSTVAGLQIDTTVFVPYKLTAINIWATWCNPCVGELPDLQEVYEALPEGVNLLGVCIDAADEPDLAKKIIEKTGIKYESIVANEDMEAGFLSYIQAYPTTIFVDNEGNLVGEPLVGAPRQDTKQVYLDTINEHLELLNK